MPHLTVEYTSNLAQIKNSDILLYINQAALASGQFGEFDVKSRLIEQDSFLIGTAQTGQAFVFVRAAILSGRTSEIKRDLSDRFLNVLKNEFTWPTDLNVQLCVEIVDMDRDAYSKQMIRALA
jgi:5-carboxymethyl-2-hydroxymuconate isomerase